MGEKTTVELKKETWKQLNEMKEPGDSFDDVVQELLRGYGDSE